MNNKTLRAGLFAGLTLCTFAFASAQNAPAPAGAAPQQSIAKKAPKAPKAAVKDTMSTEALERRSEAMAARMTKALDLSSTQTEEVKSVLTQKIQRQHTLMTELRANANTTVKDLEKILTPEQKEKFKKQEGAVRSMFGMPGQAGPRAQQGMQPGMMPQHPGAGMGQPGQPGMGHGMPGFKAGKKGHGAPPVGVPVGDPPFDAPSVGDAPAPNTPEAVPPPAGAPPAGAPEMAPPSGGADAAPAAAAAVVTNQPAKSKECGKEGKGHKWHKGACQGSKETCTSATAKMAKPAGGADAAPVTTASVVTDKPAKEKKADKVAKAHDGKGKHHKAKKDHGTSATAKMKKHGADKTTSATK